MWNLFEPGHGKMCLMSYANNKGADQPAHPRSLISAFVVRCLNSISRFCSRNFKNLATLCGCADRFVSGRVGNSRRHVLSCRGSFVSVPDHCLFFYYSTPSTLFPFRLHIWTQYCKTTPCCSNFRIITAFFLVSEL